MRELTDAYSLYCGTVYGYLFRLCGNRDLADELTQETFFQAARQWKSFRGEAGVATWLCAISKRLYYSELRARRNAPTLLPDAGEKAAEADLSEAFVDRDLAMRAQQALHGLPEPYREVFTLRTFCEMNHQQIGLLFQKSDTWARVTYHRARMMLAQNLKGDSDE